MDQLLVQELLVKTQFSEDTTILELRNIITDVHDGLIKLLWLCKDCGKDTRVDKKDYYMVTKELWEIYGVGKDMLCMNCFENRIGHKLRISDILLCPLTGIDNPYTKEILYERKSKIL